MLMLSRGIYDWCHASRDLMKYLRAFENSEIESEMVITDSDI